jgi:hypothetical protein
MTARRFISLFAVLALVLTLGFTALPVSANGSGNSLEAALASSPMGTIVYDGTQPYLRVDCFLPGDICYAPVVDGVLEGNNTVTPSMPGLYCVTRGYNSQGWSRTASKQSLAVSSGVSAGDPFGFPAGVFQINYLDGF